MNEAAEPEPEELELLRAQDVLARRWSGGRGPNSEAPHGVVLCHQASLLGSAISRWRTRRLGGFSGDLRLLRSTGRRVAVATRFGVGAPAAVALMEELVAFGVRRFVAIGIAGGLRSGAQAGDLVVADRALCSDGTSAHYLATDGAITASARLTSRLVEVLRRHGHHPGTGTLCTTDAPYRTTQGAVERWKLAGGTAVEMEAAGLFAAARLRGVDLAAACCIADGLSAAGWRMDFDSALVATGLRALFGAAVEALDEPGLHKA